LDQTQMYKFIPFMATMTHGQ